ncbi:MAG: phenylacetate--CoA ligase family protein [Deltaproteobacteria bacterium]|nr:phenylacetate--CoA ligase family protein [Deltaproteobacteria bacterium]
MSSHPLYGIYKKLPIPLQSAACWFYGLNFVIHQYNKSFYRKLAWLLESERWSASEIEAYQNERLGNIIRDAYENVSYYRETMDKLKLRPSDITTVKDLPKLPILKKEDIRNNIDKFVSKNTDKDRLLFRHTSGTTGKSLHFHVNRETDTLQWAIWWRHRNRFGMTNKSWHVNFRAPLFTPAEQNEPPFWRWVHPMRQVVINMQHITPSKIHHIADFLNQHYFKFYTTYPSFIHSLATIAIEKGLTLKNPPEVIFMGCENTFDFQKQCVKKFTGARITGQYGFAEACGNASECEHGLYHEDFELGVMECYEPERLDDARVKGKIVCTGLTSAEFPFIRYEVGDVGIWENDNTPCPCGRQSKLLVRVEGRQDDYVITPEGGSVMRFDYIFKDAQNVMESQIVQEKLGEIVVYIVKRSSYTQKDQESIRNEIEKWISNSLKVKFVYVPEIEREPNGKFRAVKSLLKEAISDDGCPDCGLPI